MFSDFVIKIRLIRIGLSFKKTKIPVFEPATYWFTTNSINLMQNREKKTIDFVHSFWETEIEIPFSIPLQYGDVLL